MQLRWLRPLIRAGSLDAIELCDSPFLVGKLREWQFTVDQTPIRLAYLLLPQAISLASLTTLRPRTIANVDLIESSKESALTCMEYFLRNFSHVPDDKLTWTPTLTAKTAIRIAAHTALYAERFARMIRDRRLPAPENLTEWLSERHAEEIAITSREDMGKVF